MKLRIGVIGCGVAGMAAAVALARDGHAVTVLERFAAPRPLGAGLLLQPTGLAALEQLGLRDSVEAKGAKLHALDGRTREGAPVMELVYSRWREDSYGLGVHRSVLFDALYRALRETPAKLVLGAAAAELISGIHVSVRDEAGQLHGPFDLALVADGAHSGLRHYIRPRARAPLYPWAALWTIRPDPDNRWRGALRQVYDGSQRMMGVLPIGAGPNDSTRYVAVFWSLRRDTYNDWLKEGVGAWRETLHHHWPQAAQLFHGELDPESLALAAYRDVQARPWRQGRVLMLGDAAHGTSPQLGQGANLALADSLALRDALRVYPTDLDAAMRNYDRARAGLVAWTQLLSRALTPVFQSDSRLIGWARDRFFHKLGQLPGADRLMLATLVGAARAPWRA
jgi:2-polyprenyl-6-methoxyphenol hydroxylase-like FAD-dependent oxidoreductase